MTDLVIDRLDARAAVASPDDEARVHTLLSDLTGHRLDEALAAASIPHGHWCVRRLNVALDLDPGRGDAALGRGWAQVVTGALLAALSTDSADVVCYHRPADAVTDVVAALAHGRLDRHWAWRSMGVLTAADPDPGTDPADAALAALTHDHVAALPALTAAVDRAGLPAVHRLLGEPGWLRAASLILAATGAQPATWLVVDDAEPPAEAEATSRVRPVLDGIVARSRFAAAWRRSRLRPAPATARAWAVLAAAEAEPALFRRPGAQAVLRQLPAVLGEPSVPTATWVTRTERTEATAPEPATASAVVSSQPAPEPDRGVGDQPGAGRFPDRRSGVAFEPLADRVPHETADPGVVDGTEPAARPAAGTASFHPRTGMAGRGSSVTDQVPDGNAAPPAPLTAPTAPAPHDQDTDVSAGLPTDWGGLVYLLAVAAAAGIPDELLDDDELDRQPLSWILYHLLRTLTLPADGDPTDPAVPALAGLPTGASAPAPPTGAQRARLDRHADRWAMATATRLAEANRTEPDADPRTVVARIASRPGLVHSEPGWVEFRLRLDDVDLAVRRAGLDLDPGFVPWLGAVVVIRYA
jgi:hypothetical protein